MSTPSITENQKVQRGWYYVQEPSVLPESIKHSYSGDGISLTTEDHGSAIRSIVVTPTCVPWTGLLRIQKTVAAIHNETNDVLHIHVTPEEENTWEDNILTLQTDWYLAQTSRHDLQRELQKIHDNKQASSNSVIAPTTDNRSPTSNVLFFESLMHSDQEYNDAEMSQGVLHMVSAIDHLGVTPIFAKVKMPIEGEDRPVQGLENLHDALGNNDIGLICISLLEGYWDGVVKLIQHIRDLGCRARIAVGGVMPTLTPEHVAAHLPDVSFICRGAGEYFLPKIVSILGNCDIDTPLSDAQLYEFAKMDGLILRTTQHHSNILVTGRSDIVVQVENLNKVPLNLQYVTANHLVGGIEIATSRGCIHRCTFCNIIGRESYQARSAENILELLSRYHERFTELFGTNIPKNCWRVHIADDDFACDKPRAAQFFRDLLHTPFRLSSVQVSVADLCRKEHGNNGNNGKLLPEPDPLLCDAIQAECFADHHAQIPIQEYIEDHKPRKWSSFLQIGVETFSNKELVRLGKGYRLEHIQAVVQHMAERRIHMDAYFIQSNSQTSAEDLLEGLIELIRLKIKYPVYFHVRYPPVPHLVSYFPSATHRRHIKQGKTHAHKLRGCAKVEGYPEYDYPFVDHDIPSDPWVEVAIAQQFFSGDNLYTQSLENLSQIWTEHWHNTHDPVEKKRGQRLLRILDDLPRSLLFENLAHLRLQNLRSTNKQSEQLILQQCSKILGHPDTWKLPLQRFIGLGVQRLVLIPTWQCELRCRYCYIRKQDGRVMPWQTACDSVDLLMTSRQKHLMLQFFGGEALLEWDMVQKTIVHASQEAQLHKKDISFVISTNGWSVDKEKLDWLSNYNVKLELSLDGDSDTQNDSRRAADESLDSYANSIATKASLIQQYNFFHDVIMVVPPKQIHKLSHNFIHIAEQGWKRIQINYALGMLWSKEEKSVLASELMCIAKFLVERWKENDPIAFINIEQDPINMRLNGEITIDWDGTLHAGNAFLLKGRKADELVLGRVNDLCNFDRYWLDVADNDILLDSTYHPSITENNLEVGKICNSFIRWMRGQYLQEITQRKMHN